MSLFRSHVLIDVESSSEIGIIRWWYLLLLSSSFSVPNKSIRSCNSMLEISFTQTFSKETIKGWKCFKHGYNYYSAWGEPKKNKRKWGSHVYVKEGVGHVFEKWRKWKKVGGGIKEVSFRGGILSRKIALSNWFLVKTQRMKMCWSVERNLHFGSIHQLLGYFCIRMNKPNYFPQMFQYLKHCCFFFLIICNIFTQLFEDEYHEIISTVSTFF